VARSSITPPPISGGKVRTGPLARSPGQCPPQAIGRRNRRASRGGGLAGHRKADDVPRDVGRNWRPRRRFACLTAARSGELRGATWSEFDLKAGTWIPFSPPALAVLAIMKPAKVAKDAFVFLGARPKKPMSDVGLLKALHAAAGHKGVTVHELRSTFRRTPITATTSPRWPSPIRLATRSRPATGAATCSRSGGRCDGGVGGGGGGGGCG
jgi:integrase